MSPSEICIPARYYRSFPVDRRGHVTVQRRAAIDRVALLLVDVYGTGFDDGVRPAAPPLMSSWSIWERQRELVLSRVAPLVDAWRAANLPIVYAENRYPNLAWERGKFAGWWERTTGFDVRQVVGTEGPQSLYSPCLAPQDSDFVVPKSFDNGFHASGLPVLLRNLGITDLIVAGFAAECCVLATIQGATEESFAPLLVRDACLADEHLDTEDDLLLTQWAVRVIESSRCESALSQDVMTAIEPLAGRTSRP